jgi:protein phosphatase
MSIKNISLKGKIAIHGRTDAGRYRDHNEDNIGYDEDIALAVLADGMGGHRSGEIASAMTVSTVIEYTTKNIDTVKTGEIDKDTGYSAHSRLICDAINEANNNVFQASRSNGQYRGMGTTVVVLIFYDNRMTVAHVGDSRLYRLRENRLEQLTRDHSLTQELLDRGFYTPEQARSSVNKNMITRAIGIDEEVQIDIHEDDALPGDIYLLCSDGVNDMISDDLISSILTDNKNDLERSTDDIIDNANQSGGKDNISALLAHPIRPFPAKNSLFFRLFNLFS